MIAVNKSNKAFQRMSPKIELAAVVTVGLTAIFMLSARPLGISPGKALLGGATILGAGGITMLGIHKFEDFQAKVIMSKLFF